MTRSSPLSKKILKKVQEYEAVTPLRKGPEQKWAKVPLGKRVAILQKFGKLLESNIKECGAVLTSEVGKPLQQSYNEVNGAHTRIKWLTDNATKYLSEEVVSAAPGMTEKIVYEPLGVI
jgi:acyl-CoA reductase-like NAD-dependent aldehyde dehydrogenase